jgi:hypothetical protein
MKIEQEQREESKQILRMANNSEKLIHDHERSF